MKQKEEDLLRKAHTDRTHQRLHGKECRVCMLIKEMDSLREVIRIMSYPGD